MKVAMFEGLKRARSGCRHCGSGKHLACVKNRRGGATSAARKKFKKAAKACKHVWKKRGSFASRRNAYNKCIRVKIKGLKRTIA